MTTTTTATVAEPKDAHVRAMKEIKAAAFHQYLRERMDYDAIWIGYGPRWYSIGN